MKKLLFFSIAMGLFMGINAQNTQTEIRKMEPATLQKHSVEKATEMLLTKDVSILHNMDKPVHKANYTYYRQISNAAYAAVVLGGHPDYRKLSTDGDHMISSQSYLFPDSLAFRFQYDIADSKHNIKYTTFASAGFVFDPYSLSFDEAELEGLFRDTAGVAYGYRLDTLWTVINYRLPHAYDPSSPDTLRFYLTYYDPYDTLNRGSDFYTLRFIGSEGKALSPVIDYTNPIPSKGPYATKPKEDTPKTFIINYLLSDQDSMLLSAGYVGLKPIGIPVNDGFGFNVPAGSCLSVIAKYIPGYNYDLDDTIQVLTYNSELTGSQLIKEELQNNLFAIANWVYDTSKKMNMFDRLGYNGSLHETYEIRYATDTTDFGLGAYYSPGYYGKPVFFMSLSVSEDDTVHLTTVGITKIENLISNIYPNPAETQLNIDLKNAGNANVIVYDILGQVVLQETLQGISNKINIAALSPGMYFVKVYQNGQIHTVKMSKK